MKCVKKVILSLYHKDGYFSFSINNIANLYLTCFGVMALDLIIKFSLNTQVFIKEINLFYLMRLIV